MLPWQVGPNKYIYGPGSIITGQQYGFYHTRQSSLETWFHLLIRLTISSHSFHLSLAVKPGAIQPAASLHVSRTPGPGGEGIPTHRPRSRLRCLCWGFHCKSLPSGQDAKTITKSSASWKTRKLESKPRPMPKFGNVNEKRLSRATKFSKGTHFWGNAGAIRSILEMAWSGVIWRSWKRFWPGRSSDPGSKLIPDHKDWIVRDIGPWKPTLGILSLPLQDGHFPPETFSNHGNRDLWPMQRGPVQIGPGYPSRSFLCFWCGYFFTTPHWNFFALTLKWGLFVTNTYAIGIMGCIYQTR